MRVAPGRALRSCGLMLVGGTLLVVARSASAQGDKQQHGTNWGKEAQRGGNRGQFSVIFDEERRFKLQRAEALAKAGKSEEAIEHLLDVIRCAPSAVFATGLDSYVGLRRAAREALGQLTGRAADVYEHLVASEAQTRFRTASLERSPELLSRLAADFPHTKIGDKARRTAGDLFLERGNVLAALQEYTMLAGDPSIDGRRLLCRSLFGLPLPAKQLGRAELRLGGKPLPEAEWEKRVHALTSFGYDANYWPSFGGGLEGSRYAPEPVGPYAWEDSKALLTSTSCVYNYNVHAIGDGQRVYVSTGTAIQAFDLLSHSQAAWSWQSPLIDDPKESIFLKAVSRYQVHSPAIGGSTVVVPIQVPVTTDQARNPAYFNQVPIITLLPVRRLFAFDADSGRIKWSHWEEGRSLPRDLARAAVDVSGPPLVVGDTVYVAAHKQLGTIAFYLSAFDLKTGRLKWSTLLLSSQIEVNMFGNAPYEFAASPLVWSDGNILGSSNLGACFSVRANDGSINWLEAYETIPIPQSRMMPQQRPVFWANNAPVVADGVVVMTPLDSREAIALETRTGACLWTTPYYVTDPDRPRRFPPELRWLLGVSNNQVYFSGHCVATVPLRPSAADSGVQGRQVDATMLVPPQIAGFENYYRELIPRGLMTEKHIYVPSSEGLLIFDHRGRLISRQRGGASPPIGNLFSSRGVLVSVTATSDNQAKRISWFFDGAELAKRASSEARAHPQDPAATINVAEILSATAGDSAVELGKAIELFERATRALERNGVAPGAKLMIRARYGTYDTLRHRARLLAERNPAAAMKAYVQAIAIGEHLVGHRSITDDLIRTYETVLDEFSASSPFTDNAARNGLLAQLEARHAASVFSFRRFGRIPVGLFVQLVRLTDLGDSRPNAAQELALLRRVLVDYGSEVIHGITGRDFALDRMRKLIARHGRSIYVRYEQEAKDMLARSGGDMTRLRHLVSRYPLSKSATAALLRLADRAAETGDLKNALDALELARQRLPELPRKLFESVAAAASKAGNLQLERYLRYRLADKEVDSSAFAETRRLMAPDLSSDAKEIDGKGVAVRALRYRRMPGPDAPKLPALVIHDEHWLIGLDTESNSLEDSRFMFRFEESMLRESVEPVVFGDTLILPEDERVRAVRLTDGHELWRLENEGQVKVSGALVSGLYFVCTRRDDTSSFRIHAFEPQSGQLVFTRDLATPTPPTLRAGRLFRVEKAGESDSLQLVLLDELTGWDRTTIALDGKLGPRIPARRLRYATGRILVTDRDILVLDDDPPSNRPRALYSLSVDGSRANWQVVSRSIGPADDFFVLGDQVFLTSGLGERNEEAYVLQIDRAKGTTVRTVSVGLQAFVADFRDSGQKPEPRLVQPGPLLFLGMDRRTRAVATLLDPRPDKPSWAQTLGWSRNNLGLNLVPGCPAYGRDLILLAKQQLRRRGGTGSFDLEFVALDRKDGHVIRKFPARSLTGTVTFAVHNGHLLEFVNGQSLDSHGRTSGTRIRVYSSPEPRHKEQGR